MITVQEERKFLHDLSSPLTITHGNLKILLKKFESEQQTSDHDDSLKRLQHAMAACERLAVMLSERRQYLIALGQELQDSAKSGK
ncbi:MAG: hypothetical protein ACOH5I_11465 [Oligoflexus sp.]